MSLQIRRGPNQGAGGRTGVTLVQGEIAFVTDYATANVSPMWIGDGVTLGGIPVSPVLSVNGLTGQVSLTTNEVGEGSLNKYFTSIRASDAVGAMLAAGTLSGLAITYNSTTHAITISNTNVIQAGTSGAMAYWATNGTTLTPSQSITWSESSNNLNILNGNFSLQNNYSGSQNLTFTTYSTNNTTNSAVYRKARGTNITPTTIVAGDGLQIIAFQGHDGTTFRTSSEIKASSEFNTTVSTGIVPGTLGLYATDTTGVSSPRITASGLLGGVVVGPYYTTDTGSGLMVIRQTVTSNGKVPLNIFNIFGDAYGAQISLNKARGTFATPAAVQVNDTLSAFNFRGHYGTGYATAVSIQGEAAAAPSASGYVPGALVFKVTNGSGILTEAMRINYDNTTVSNGNFTVNGTLTVNGSTVTTNTTTINVEDKLMKLGYLFSSQVSTTGAVGSIKGLLLQGSTTFTSSGVSVTAAATYTGISQTATTGTGTGAVFTVQKTGSAPNYCSTVTFASGTIGSIKGALLQASTTFAASGTSVTAASTYTGVTQSATSGTGTGAVFTIQKIGVGTAYNGAIVITITTAGTGYAIGDTITIPGASLGGATPANNLVLTVATALGSPWIGTVTGLSGVAGLVIGGTINAAAGTGLLYGGSPTSVVITTIGSTSITYTVTGGTTPVAGTITSLVQSSNLNITITSAGNGYAVGDTVTLPGASLGGATPANNLVLTVATTLGGPWTATITGMADTVDLQVGSAITATGSGTSGTITATATTHATASCTAGSITGSTFTVSGTVSGSFVIGMALSGSGISPGTYIVSGSGTTWNLNISDTVGSTTITGTADLITVSSTSSLQLNTIITTPSAFGGLATSITYYVNNIASATQFSVATTAGGTTQVTLTTATGSVSLTYLNGSLGSGGSYLISNILSATSVTYVATGGTIPIAGPVTNISTNGATDYTANGGGIQVYGATNKTFTWNNVTTAWTSSEHIDIATGKAYEINGTSILSSTTLGSSVVNSSLTSIGTLGSLTVTGLTLIGSQANTTRFPNAKVIISDVVTGQQNESGNIGIIGEVLGAGSGRNAGVYGVGYSSGTYSAQGVVGEGHVLATGDTAPSVGVRGYANDTHAGGSNVGLYGDATNGLNNYSLYLNNGNIYSSTALTWYLNGNLTFNGAYTITATAAPSIASSTASSIGYIGMPQNSQSGAYPIVIGDAGKHIYASATMTATIPANSSVAFPIGTTIAFIAAAGATLTIAITTDTMYLGGTGTTGSRTLAPYGMATAVKVTATSWFINGTGLT